MRSSLFPSCRSSLLEVGSVVDAPTLPRLLSTFEADVAKSSVSQGLSTSTDSSVARPQVPNDSWYQHPYDETRTLPMSRYHRDHRGKIIFSPRAVPTTEPELLNLPDQRPPLHEVCEIGKHLLYGMAYLYAPPLLIEHEWRCRVAHLLRVQQQQSPIPCVLRRAPDATAMMRKPRGDEGTVAAVPEALTTQQNSTMVSSSASAPPRPSSLTAGNSNDYFQIMRFSRGESAVYQHPPDDFFIGIKLFVAGVLVEDHYPGVSSLPQCTATILAREAVRSWNCVPFVLLGFLNQTMLDPICIFHTLSLNFVDHLLRIKLPWRSSGQPTVTKTSASSPSPASVAYAASLKLPLRVEVVYGCRAEAFYCSDFIARGCCVLHMTETSKSSLKGYEEKLRALVLMRRGAPLLIQRPSTGGPQPHACRSCGHLLPYRCTVCGAEVCSFACCENSAVGGYPRPCLRHSRKSNYTSN